MDTMRAVAVTPAAPVDSPDCFVEIELPVPHPGPHDLLVEVEAVSVNPIDFKTRRAAVGRDEPVVLGFDAAGTVRAVGSEVTDFSVGDPVWHSGQRDRTGSNARFTLVDHRIAARRPANLTAPQAAAMPLTAITAWEALVDHLHLTGDQPFLMVGGAGGVGSMAIQLARHLTNGPVVATASRPASQRWCEQMGATAVIDHRQDLVAQMRRQGLDGFPAVLSAYTVGREEVFPSLLAPQGHLVVIDNGNELDFMAFKDKGLTLTAESMFVRPEKRTPDMAEQGRILAEVARGVEDGWLRSTATTVLTGLSAATLARATAVLESGSHIGKVVIDYTQE